VDALTLWLVGSYTPWWCRGLRFQRLPAVNLFPDQGWRVLHAKIIGGPRRYCKSPLWQAVHDDFSRSIRTADVTTVYISGGSADFPFTRLASKPSVYYDQPPSSTIPFLTLQPQTSNLQQIHLRSEPQFTSSVHTMASSTTVYMNGAYDEPVAAHQNFQTEYNLDDPLQAMNSYARYVPLPTPYRPLSTFFDP